MNPDEEKLIQRTKVNGPIYEHLDDLVLNRGKSQSRYKNIRTPYSKIFIRDYTLPAFNIGGG